MTVTGTTPTDGTGSNGKSLSPGPGGPGTGRLQTAQGRRGSTSTDGPSLRVEGLSKTFGSKQVLRGVSFDVGRGAIHALLGGNGSGKSTLVKALSGVQPADPGGRLTVGSSSTSSNHVTPGWASEAGLRFVHQDVATFPTMSVAENLLLGHRLPGRGGWVNRRTAASLCRASLEQFQIDVSPSDKMGELRLADQTMIAIARALRAPGVGEHPISALVLDEPTAALPEEEVEVLLEAVRRAASSGVSVIYISHRLEEVLAVADEVTVLRDGARVASGPTAGLTEQQLIEWIVGQPLEDVFPPPSVGTAPGDEVLALRNIAGGPLRDVSLSVRRGEIVGLAGLLGSGRSELLRSVFGDHRTERGSITVSGRTVDPDSPASAMADGVAYVPENRGAEAAFPDLSVRTNMCTADRRLHTRWGLLRRDAERDDVLRSMTAYVVRAPDEDAPMSSLSGGNQQKVVLARWMRQKPALLLLDEPTQGVDVGARADVYHLIRAAVDEGLAVVLVSSDFEELAEMSDRVLVLREGTITAEVSGPDLTRHRLNELVLTSRETSTNDG